MSKLRVIGDVHGCINIAHPHKNISYRDIIKDVDFSVQLGDMGFNYSGLKGIGNRHVLFQAITKIMTIYHHKHYHRMECLLWLTGSSLCSR